MPKNLALFRWLGIICDFVTRSNTLITVNSFSVRNTDYSSECTKSFQRGYEWLVPQSEKDSSVPASLQCSSVLVVAL